MNSDEIKPLLSESSEYQSISNQEIRSIRSLVEEIDKDTRIMRGEILHILNLGVSLATIIFMIIKELR